MLSLTASWAAHAVLDQVAPETVPVYTSRMCITGHPISSCQANTLRAACDLYYRINMAGGYIVENPAPVFTGILGGYAQLQYTYSCLYNFYYMHNVSSIPYQAYYQDGGLAIVDVTPPLCPAATPAYKFNAVSGMCERDLLDVLETCPVHPLTQPPFPDACSTSLEQGKGEDVNKKCGSLREPDMVAAAACIADKINKLSSPAVNPKYTNPSATIRTEAYQNHLLEIWTKSERLNTIMKSVVYTPETKQACAATYAAVNKEKAEHGIRHKPSSSGDAAPHVERRAIDVPEAVSDALMDQVTTYTTTYIMVNGKSVPGEIVITSDVEDYIHSATVNPPACDSNISWGGRFDPSDWVHFQLP